MTHIRGAWQFTITTETGDRRRWDWAQLTALPAEQVTKDIHCVTKWLTGLDLMTRDHAGFWEQLGYHDYGDPWREQRYQGD